MLKIRINLVVAMPSKSEVARRLLEHSPGARVVFLCMYRSPAIVHEALSTGALGYVSKALADEGLGPAIRAALEGRSFVSASESSAF